MDFINKLIKKGIFCLILVFGIFVLVNGTNVQAAAADCSITLNDEDKFLVLSTNSKWSDRGVTANCGTKENNITVNVNGGSEIKTENSALGTIDSYLTKAGFYTVTYKITNQSEMIYGKTFITRQIRVLPANLNNAENIWLGETSNVTSKENDLFNKVLVVEGGYLAVGNFNEVEREEENGQVVEKSNKTIGYVVKFNVRGEYEWSWKTTEYSGFETSSVEILDMIESPISDKGIYYISGSINGKGFIKPLSITSNNGVDSSYGSSKIYEGTTKINRIAITGNYIVGVGAFTNNQGINTGVILSALLNVDSGEIIDGVSKYENILDSEYTSLTVNKEGKIIAVGYEIEETFAGAIGGTVTVCESGSTLTCETPSLPLLYKDEGLNNAIVTRFTGIIEDTNGYLIIGQTRAVKLEGSETTNNAGLEDILVVYGNFDSQNKFQIKDMKLRGSASSDNLYSIKKIDDNKYIVVGNIASSGYYGFVNINGLSFSIEDKFMSGDSYSVFNDVAISKSTTNTKEVQYIFVGLTKSKTFEGILVQNKGNEESLFVILDDTEFENYSNINVLKNGSICEDGISTDCSGENVSKDYWLSYGDEKYSFVASISTTIVKTINTIHEFTNSQGVKFKIGRVINVVESPVASDIVLDNMGIDKWYLYSRSQTIGSNASGYERKELWEQYFYPVEDGLDKVPNQYYKLNYDTFILDTTAGKTFGNYKLLTPGYEAVEDGLQKEANQYYKLDNGNYVLDDETGVTSNNYKLVSVEPQQNNVAFQSIEKAKEYAMLQEFTRIALVKEKYSDDTAISTLKGELTELNDQNFYFIYYMDIKISDGICELKNTDIIGNCNAALGYAFTNLEKIKNIIEMILEKKNYFVSESNNKFNSSYSEPVSEEYKEELSTIQYTREKTFNVEEGLYLDVKYYALNTANPEKYTFSTTYETLTEQLKGKSRVSFAATGDVTYEGKFVVRYCYSDVTCGAEAEFVIDRTKPIINYVADRGEEEIVDSIQVSWDKTQWFKMKGDATITSISDIDPYAYTIVSGKKYYLRCNEEINSESCIKNVAEFVKREYNYDPEDPNKLYSISVYDRASNKIEVYFKVATGNPTINIPQSDSLNDFTLTVDFFKKNEIDGFKIMYTPSETCEMNCTDADELAAKIKLVIEAYNFWNKLEDEKAKKIEGYEPDYKKILDVPFSLSIGSKEGEFEGGAILPLVEYNEELKGYLVVEGETETLPISKGLYKVSITDVFNLTTSKTGGIGIDKAKLDVYVNDDEWYTDEDVKNGDYLLPKTPEEDNREGEDDSIFKVRIPNTYDDAVIKLQDPSSAKGYKDLITTEALKSSISEEVFFANQFVFVKIKENSYGITEIRKATGINYVGTPSTYECMFVIYGSGITNTNSLNQNCTTKIPLNALSNTSILNDKGIYILGKDGDVQNGYYYYFAFSLEGIYNVTSKVEVSTLNNGVLALDVDATFIIDYTVPTITPKDYMETDSEGNCITNGKVCYEIEDFIFTSDNNKIIPNIGQNSMTIDLTTEVFNGVATTRTNRLLLVRINGELHNAYDYSKNILGVSGGDKLIFEDDGKYEITFIDASLNEITIKFIIDKEAPVIKEFRDIDTEKDVSKYQQYIQLEINIEENSFLQEKTGKVMLTINYWFDIPVADVKDSQKNTITIQNNDGACFVALGNIPSDSCAVEGERLTVTFILSINEIERETKSTTLYVEAYDYFENGKGIASSQTFDFDNAAPHIYYNTNNYTPTTNFGENVNNEERKKWLSIDVTASLKDFDCKATDTLIGGIVVCNDTPEYGKDNGVVVNAYEAYKAASSNFSYINGTYTPLKDGSYVSPNVNLYTGRYLSFTSKSNLESKIASGTNVFYHADYFKVTTEEKVDPNKTYYYGDSKEVVRISDMYENYSSYSMCDETEAKCKLYKMYISENSKFTDTDFYYTDSDKYIWIDDIQNINTDDYSNYYYAADYESDEDLSDNYLPALILANSKVEYNNSKNYIDAPEGAIKLNSSDIKYYNVIQRASTTKMDYVTTLDTNVYALLDTRVWRIAENEPFSFVLPSVVGRPIIFKAVDGAGNHSSNHIETVILVKDKDAPTIKEVSSISYVLDSEKGNYKKVTSYYKVGTVGTLNCETSTTTYYTDINGQNPINCSDMVEGGDYFAAVSEFVYTTEKESGVVYYSKVINSITNGANPENSTNYLTKDNFEVIFSEPIYRITCSYYDNKDGKTKLCDFSNTEFDYREEKMTFNLIHEEMETYVNYELTVYDFSNNATTVNYFFIDRDAPVLEFEEEKGETETIYVAYTGDKATNYTNLYIDGGYINDVYATDSVDDRISGQSLSGIIKNDKVYHVEFYKYNFNVTYKNYIKNGNAFEKVDDHKLKDANTDYYILIKEPQTTDYILKDMNKVCSDGYCYVLDDSNYYPVLKDHIPNENEVSHWTKIEDNKILKDKVGVYKVVYTVTDYSGNTSDKLIRTVYIVDKTPPKLMLNENPSTETNGYHNNVKISFSGEGEAHMVEYKCNDTALTCQLPKHMFEPEAGFKRYDENNKADLGSLSATYDKEGLYKIFAYDKGYYIESVVSDGDSDHAVMTLKYNYTEYQFVIDRTAPVMTIDGYVDTESNKLYYKLEVNEDVNLYCVMGTVRNDKLNFNNYKNCAGIIQGSSTIKVNTKQENGQDVVSSVDYIKKNAEGIEVSIIKYKKLEVGERKYFYKKYYKNISGVEGQYEFKLYEPNESYEEENVYMISYMSYTFVEDGRYIVQASDAAKNTAGRKIDAQSMESYRDEGGNKVYYSIFDIDNTAPNYNKLNTAPTGVNMWFSAPSKMIETDKEEEIINGIHKDNPSDLNYNLFNSGLNKDLFYAFATQAAAKEYIKLMVYEDINEKSKTYIEGETKCTVAPNRGKLGFEYSYYDIDEQGIITGCFNKTGEKTAIQEAKDTVSAKLQQLVYRTFSGDALFGQSGINQKVYDDSSMEKYGNMYKIVYLEEKEGHTSVSETCTPSATVKCIKINVKIVKYESNATRRYAISGTTVLYNGLTVGHIEKENNLVVINEVKYTISGKNIKDSNGNVVGTINDDGGIGSIVIGGIISLDIGGINTIDTDKITVYKKQGAESSTSKIYDGAIELSLNTYYVFMETDKPIEYINYPDSETITHFNTNYYAIYVDTEEKVDVHYEMKDEGEDSISGKLVNANVKNNADEYYVIIKQGDLTKSQFIKAYEIYEYWVEEEVDGKKQNVLKEVYSYMKLNIDGVYKNLNDYIVKEGNEYYFKISIAQEHKTQLELYDRAGNKTSITISRTQIAPDIRVEYDGADKDLEVNLSIADTSLASTIKNSVKVYFSEDGSEYTEALTTNIKASLVCLIGSTITSPYGCKNLTNGRYLVNIRNYEDLYGFFKVTLTDDHGNSNSLEFVYNPLDFSETYYDNSEIKFITTTLDDDPRMVKNEPLKIRWNNKWNYVLLYEVINGEIQEQPVCNTKNISTGDGGCGDGKIVATFDQTSSKYQYSTLTYFKNYAEGETKENVIYLAKVVNRASEVIYEACYDNGELKENCSKIKPTTTNECNSNYPDYCAGVNRFKVREETIGVQYDGYTYTKFEVDVLAPSFDINDFEVVVPSGPEIFESGKAYTNAKVTIVWEDKLSILKYKCEYLKVEGEENCAGNWTSYNDLNKTYTFEITNKMDTKYTFWFEDYAGNTTESDSLNFTINVKLPEIVVYQLDGNNEIIPEKVVENGAKINTNAMLRCYSDRELVNCATAYAVHLYRKDPLTGAYTYVSGVNNTVIREDFENQYKYIVLVKSTSGYEYENLSSEIEFTIDKVAPNIVVVGEKDQISGIYKGIVDVIIDGGAKGNVYGDCVDTGIVNEYGDKQYECSNEPILENFENVTTLNKTGIYKITAVDDIGNVTVGNLVKFVAIDNDKPTISVNADAGDIEYALAENGYTNVENVIITSIDNNPNSYIKYRVKKGAAEEYGEWIIHGSNSLVISEEGMYEVMPIDLVGNEGRTKHFIIYRQTPQFSVYVGNSTSEDTSNQIIKEDVKISWKEPQHITEAPIVKVTINGRPYQRNTVISETGEYVFVFTDLAGNSATHKLTINKNPNICLDNVKILPKNQYLFHVDNIKLNGGAGYTFKENDVIIFATPSTYYAGASACGENILCYKSLGPNEYILLDKSTADYINNHKNVGITLEKESINKIRETGGFVYAFIVDYDVATKDLGFKIGENFFTEDPLGWILIFTAGAGVIYMGLKLFVFRKKVKVLK